MKKEILWIGLAMLVPIIFWLFFFHDNPFSHQSEDWANFGSYVGGIVTSVSIPITMIYVLKAYQSQKRLEQMNVMSQLKNEFDSRWFELLRLFTEYRFQLESWSQVENKPETREYFRGLKWFLHRRRAYQNTYIKLMKEMSAEMAHHKALEATIDQNDLAFEFFYRCIEVLIQTIENHHSNIIKYDPNNQDRQAYFHLLSTSLTNDQMFFVRYCNDYKQFQGRFLLLKMYSEKLTSEMFRDYKSTPE